MSVDEIYDSANQTLLEELKEDRRVEKKSVGIHARELGDYFSMWANTAPDGGLIIIGIENDNRTTGCLKISQEHINKLEQAGETFAPEAKYEHKRVSIRLLNKQSDFILLIRVYYRDTGRVVRTTSNNAYVRIGSDKRKLDEYQIREIEVDKGFIDFEKEPSRLVFPDDFNVDLIQKYIHRYIANKNLTETTSIQDILQISHLGKIEGTKFVPNNACALLFAKDPKDTFPGCKIRFLRFDGETEGTGEKWNVVKDIWIDEGSIPRLIVETEKVLDAQIRDFSKLGTDGIFYTMPEYPKSAWYETIVNACVHRSYTQKTMPIFIKLFDDRFVVESPGGFPPLVTPENIYDMHCPRNPHLMNAMYYLDFVKCAHEGTRRIREAMKQLKLPSPKFEQKEVSTGLVRVTLQNDIKHRKVWIDKDATAIVGAVFSNILNQHQKRVINFVAEHGKISVSQAMRLIKNTWYQADKLLKHLVELGILEIKRNPKLKDRDPGARYFLKQVQDDESGE